MLMTSPDVSLRGFIMFSASVLGWIVWLTCALDYLFGAGMTVGWLVVGILISLMAIGVILMLNSLLTAVEGLYPKEWQESLPLAKLLRLEKRGTIRNAVTTMADDRRSNARSYRIALGLEPRVCAANRRRTKHFPAGRSRC